MNKKTIVGWDVGGAHVKVAVFRQDEGFENVIQLPCPLWKGEHVLEHVIQQVMQNLPSQSRMHGITMTGELVDLFENRDQGVERIVRIMNRFLTDEEVFIYAGKQGFIPASSLSSQHYRSIASANWLASVTCAARQLQNGLFIDVGSTTTDILVFKDNDSCVSGFTDFERLRSHEMVYSGIVRTPVMAVAQSAAFGGQMVGMMAEYFATMADVYRLTGELNEDHDQYETCDGADKTVPSSARRLSRMIGYDFLEADLSLWKLFAESIKSKQRQIIRIACEQQLSRGLISRQDPFVGAGIGRFLVKQIAAELGYPYQDFNHLLSQAKGGKSLAISDCAPAAAVAYLLSQT